MKKLLLSLLCCVAVVFELLACAAVTQKGTVCKRAPVAGSAYCWQHGGGATTRASQPTRQAAASTAKTPKSYEVYWQRQTQGPRNFSKKMKERKYGQQGGRCTHCGARCPYSEMEGDHIMPYSKGGKTDYDNLQMLCRPCNRRKGNRYSY